jgi:hypothetical protein
MRGFASTIPVREEDSNAFENEQENVDLSENISFCQIVKGRTGLG